VKVFSLIPKCAKDKYVPIPILLEFKLLQQRVISTSHMAEGRPVGQLHWSPMKVILWPAHHAPAVLPRLTGYPSWYDLAPAIDCH